tara:strand:+ start:73692 stop:74882 length:1191 start_codon:yes stop_codon:yes gene_type:complete
MPQVKEPPQVLPYSCQWIDQSDVDAVVDTLRSDFLTQGPQVGAFEEALCDYLGVKYAVAVSNGTAALHLACAALKQTTDFIGVTTPITFAASANCLLYNQAGVRFCDVDPLTGLMDVKRLEVCLNSLDPHQHSSGVIIPVSLNGQVPQLDRIQLLAQARGWSVIEDAAHSLGASYQAEGKTILSGSCAHTDMAILSFHPLKHICAGEGGAVLTNNKELADKVRLLRSHGIVRPDPKGLEKPEWFYEQVDLGFNYRMTDIQASLGRSQLTRLDFFLERRRALARRYQDLLQTPEFKNYFNIVPQVGTSAFHLFVIHFHKEQWRDYAHRFLKERGILTQVHYAPVCEHPYYKEHFDQECPAHARQYYEGCLSIPLAPKMSESDQDRVIEGLNALCEEL